MPIYMDVHIVPGVKARNVAEAHRLDLLHQEEYGCNCMTYWIDEVRESIFCLIEAPTKEAVEQMHKVAHGLIPNKIVEVNQDVVQSFLGRIYDPEDAEKTDDGLTIFCSPSFRVLLIIQTKDPALLKNSLGVDEANRLIGEHAGNVRKGIKIHGGSEVEHEGDDFIISFTSAQKAQSCAIDILTNMDEETARKLGSKICLNGGEPLENSNKLYGDVIQLAQNMCSAAKSLQIAITSRVKALIPKEQLHSSVFSISPQDEALLHDLYNKLEEHWQDPEFDVEDYCQAMAMSKSQLYRKTTSLLGMSPNDFLKEFRLEKGKELLRKEFYTISQVTFDTGFSSPSYFTKCFKKKYGLLPMSYIELSH
jgi:AraC-like DNA-binding protein